MNVGVGTFGRPRVEHVLALCMHLPAALQSLRDMATLETASR